MEEIITNEWIAYKAGFIDAKGELAEKFAFNLPDPFTKEELEVGISTDTMIATIILKTKISLPQSP